jgi:replicative DNA helicase
MLLHREDAYDRDIRPGEADIIVAKHRGGPTKTIPVAFHGHLARFVDIAPGMGGDGGSGMAPGGTPFGGIPYGPPPPVEG